MDRIWKYLVNGKVKHYFVNEIAQLPICKTDVFMLNDWQTDTAGLSRRSRCIRCVGEMELRGLNL